MFSEPVIAFPRVRTTCVLFLCPLAITRVCVVYVVKEVVSFPGGAWLGQSCSSSATAAGRKKESCYVKTGTNSNLIYLKYIPKVLQDPLKSKEST